MKRIRFLIIGLLAIPALLLTANSTHADEICNPNNIKDHYTGLYCGVRVNDNETFDDKLVGTLSSQFSIDKETIKEILSGTICESFAEYDEAKKAKQPQAVKDACLPTGLSTTETMGGWNVFMDIRHAYEKENVIQRSAASLKFKFKASEQYWDGKVYDPITNTRDAPFDLIVDLNLIEIVLFGSKAQWMQDVYTFPKKEEGGAGGETPMDSALPPAEGATEPTPTPATPEEGGLTVTEEGGESTVPGDCVPPDDPNADKGDEPGSSYENPLCGNKTVDILMGEECDDGNTQSGDGCSQYCKTEISGSNANGSDNQCVDPEAITFKKPEQQTEGAPQGPRIPSAPATGTNISPLNPGALPKLAPQCPDGTVPKKSTSITGTEGELPPTVAQSPEYPGPSLGGTLKQYPTSNPPVCQPGESQFGTNDDGTPRCLPTELCVDPEVARTVLAALPPLSIPNGDWKSLPDTDPRKKMAEAIEAVFCVNITKANRPKAPYQTNEGCIDCHITAIVDSLEKALETNVSPLINTTSAFGISSKYGPSFSFNLSTAVKSNLKYVTTGANAQAVKSVDENAAKSQRENTPATSTVKLTENLDAQLSQKADEIAATMAAVQDDTRMFKMSDGVISDQEIGARIIPLITQMRDSFVNIQSKYEGIIGSTALDEKKQCKP